MTGTATATPTDEPERESYRAYIELLQRCDGLAEAMVALTDSQSSAITALRDTFAAADPVKIDAGLREVIRAAQKARKALKGEAA